MFLTSDATAIAETMVLSNNRLMAGSELQESAEYALGLPARALALPSPRTDFVPVYSDTKNVLFIAGGVDGDGEEAGDIWSGVPGQQFSRLTLSSAFGTVHAATFDASRNALFVIDEVLRDDQSVVRLLQVDADFGHVSEIRALPARKLNGRDVAQLKLNRSGKKLVLALQGPNNHVILKLDPSTGKVLGRVRGEGRLEVLSNGRFGLQRLSVRPDGFGQFTPLAPLAE